MTKPQPKPEPDLKDLLSSAMLVKFSASCWGVAIHDHSVEGEIADKHKSNASMLKFRKVLLKSKARDEYKAVAREAYAYHLMKTLMWDKGVGLLPATLFWEYNEAMEGFKRRADQHADDFVVEYKKEWSNGMSSFKAELGGLFNREDYPDPSSVRRKFGIRIRIRPLENPNDFRVKLGSGQTEAVKAQIMEDLKADIAEVVKEPYRRLSEVITKVHAKLSDAESVFRDSLIENVKELVEILPALNVTGDAELAALVEKTKSEICIDNVDTLRKDAKFRASVAKSAQEILKGMKGYAS